MNLAEVGRQVGLGSYNLRGRKGFMAKVEDFYKDAPNNRKSLILRIAEAIHKQRGVSVILKMSQQAYHMRFLKW